MNRATRFQITQFDDLNKTKADEYAYWQSQPRLVRLKAASDLTREAYSLNGKPAPVLQ
jgi:hypothetical protein